MWVFFIFLTVIPIYTGIKTKVESVTAWAFLSSLDPNNTNFTNFDQIKDKIFTDNPVESYWAN